MIKLRPYIFLLIFLSAGNFAFSQVGIGQWQDHTPRSKGISLCESNNKIYCITETGAFFINKDDNSIHKLSKINGLSGINTTAIIYDKTQQKTIIGYQDGNLDIISSNTITHLSDIQRKAIYGSKKINRFISINSLIYMATNFGIVVFNPRNNEFIDTYYIGDNGNSIVVNDITSDGTYLYAATEKGIKKALLSNPQLANYVNWHLIDDGSIPHYKENFNTLAYFQNALIASHYNTSDNKHELYVVQNGTYYTLHDDIETNTQGLKLINKQLMVIGYDHISIYSNLNTEPALYNKNKLWGWTSIPSTKDAIIDKNNTIWYADDLLALAQMSTSSHLGASYQANAPQSNASYALTSYNNSTWLAAGAYDNRGFVRWKAAEFSHYQNGTWKNYGSFNIPELKNVRDIVAIEEDPTNSNHMYCASGNSGVIDITIGNTVKANIYNENNSTLKAKISTQVKIYDIHLDTDNNLWVTNPETSTPINVRTPTGQWFSFSYGKTYQYLSRFIIAKDQTKWIIIDRGGGLYLFNENGTIDNTGDDLHKKLDVRDEYGTVISNDIFSIAEDKNGEIWLGSIDGILVYHSPQKAFTGSSSEFYASKIIIEINGKAEYLMKDKKVTAIAIDGANRKWIGTAKSGIFLMSEDGTEQLEHFNTQNSPLPSDEIQDISIGQSSGEVFIATGKGLMSFRGRAIEGKDFYKNVYTFPNPVKPEYDGPITITGLMNNTQVKITDIAGNIVTEMMSEGGQAIWNGKTINGERVKTGVYLVFLSNSDTEDTQVTKILFIN